MNNFLANVAQVFSKKTLLCLLPLVFQVEAISAMETGTHSSAENDKNAISVTKAHARATIPGTEISSAYMTITNTSATDKTLVSVTGDVSKRIELHEHSMSNGMMKMRQVQSINVSANSSTVLQPSGLHIMIFNPKKPLLPNSHIKLALHFSSGDTEHISIPVQKVMPHGHHH